MEFLIGLVLLFAMIFINVPIAIAIGAIALLGMFLTQGDMAFFNAVLSLYDGASKFPLLAIPLFIVAGGLMNASSISQRLIDFTIAIIGFVRGGLSMVNVMVSMFFAEISGSAVADVAATGSILIPAMKERGYNKNFVAALTSSSASLAIIIPPSIPMILYGAMFDVSIVQLFLAGVLPGIIGGIAMMLLCYYFAVRYNLPREAAFSLEVLWKSFQHASWAFILPLIILGGIFGGLVTATEGAALAVVAALFISGVIYQELNIEMLYQSLRDGVRQTSVVMLLIGTSAVLGLYLTETGLPQKFASTIIEITQNQYAILMLLNIMFFVLGMFLHGASAIILVGPIVMPLVHTIGIDPIQFGIILTLNLAIGQQTPPVASVLITSCALSKTDIWSTTRANLPLIGVLFILLLLVTYVPQTSLLLVEFFYR